MIFNVGNTGFEQTRRNIMYNNKIIVSLGEGSYIDEAELNIGDENCIVTIGKYTSIGRNVKFIIGLNHDYRKISSYPFSTIKKIEAGETDVNPGDGEKNKKSVVIGSDVWIGTDVTILGGVRIGNGAIIGAGAVIAKSIPAYAVVVGNPGRVIKYRFLVDEIKKLEKLKWWNKGTEWVEKHISLLEGDCISDLAKYVDVANDLEKLEKLKNEGYRVTYVIPDLSSIKKDLISYIDYLKKNDLGKKNIIIVANKMPDSEERWVEQLLDFMNNDSMVVTLYEYSKRKDLAKYIDEYILVKSDISIKMLDYLGDNINVVYQGDLASRVIDYADELKKQRKIIDDYINRNKYQIKSLFNEGRYKDAMHTLSILGNIMYEYNQSYTDEMLEGIMLQLANVIFEKDNMDKADDKTILFYDGFGLDTRGLANIYLDALIVLGYRVIYVTIHNAKDKIPTVKKILNKGLNEIIYLPDVDELEQCYYISKVVNEFSPACGFLYTTPYDVAGIIAFIHFKNRMKRFLINLNDHAFWLGKNAFDYCLEFRDYGASISVLYRGISKDKLIRINFYPAVDRELKFGGFPFEKKNEDFVIFSGGFLYKTFDKDLTYYRLVEYCLKEYPQVKFWYAGYGDDSELLKLMKKYPKRVFHTAERKDLFQIMQNIDLYLDTYPVIGGLMRQYSAVAGRVPISLYRGEEHSGFLENGDELGIVFYTFEDCIKGLEHFILDDEYRHEIEKKVSVSVCTREDFVKRVKEAILYSKPSTFKINSIDDAAMREGYLKRFIKRFVKTRQ